jgi:hypothetical protein
MRSNMVTGVVNKLMELGNDRVTIAYLTYFDKLQRLNGAGTLFEFLEHLDFQSKFNKKLEEIKYMSISYYTKGKEMYELIEYAGNSENYLAAIINALFARRDRTLIIQYLSCFPGGLRVNYNGSRVTLEAIKKMVNGNMSLLRKDIREDKKRVKLEAKQKIRDEKQRLRGKKSGSAAKRLRNKKSPGAAIGKFFGIIVTIITIVSFFGLCAGVPFVIKGIIPWYYIIIDLAVFFIFLFIPIKLINQRVMMGTAIYVVVNGIIMVSFLAPIPLIILAITKTVAWYWIPIDIAALVVSSIIAAKLKDYLGLKF